jgi:hypothetical protein
MQDADNDPDELEWVIHKKVMGKRVPRFTCIYMEDLMNPWNSFQPHHPMPYTHLTSPNIGIEQNRERVNHCKL